MDFYGRKYSGRRLAWHHSLGTCVLRAAFPKGAKELSVSLFQAAVLVGCFNDSDDVSFQVRGGESLGAQVSHDWPANLGD
jgi:cullin 4